MPMWRMKDGTEISPRKMIDSHLLNVISFIYRGRGYDDCVTLELAEELFAEVEQRGLRIRIKKADFMNVVREREVNFHRAVGFLTLEKGWD